MRTFNATQDNDLALGMDGNLSVINTVEAIGQVARQAMQTRRGEMIHDVPGGIPFDAVAWAGEPNLAQFEAAARARLMQVPGVLGITEFEASMEGDVLQYTATLETDRGEVPING